MALLATLPKTTIPEGPGSITSGALATSLSVLRATLNQFEWPYAGDLAATLIAEQSNDGGATWLHLAACALADVRNAGDTTQLACRLRDVGTSGRIVRLSWDAAKALTVSGSLYGF